MGAACGKSAGAEVEQEESTLSVMFKRIDKDNKGYISPTDLKEMMKDDKTHFQGKDADHIMAKYGTDNKMNVAEFRQWWNSTYTTYNDDALGKIVEEVNEEISPLEAIPELPEIPHNSNVAISRS
ncbi:predicted protein [Phaeodactylum tricornutum CCAP 1055/1]|jgi:hypothetical protein|uniref:EF-hand domain-containing protein n=1 Tax=Phaeodactylum tricornutum (strain CCAP 1055/1) TaxID=556484 RepID=B7G025_PHATC|nr:predicted protein [Phaeodactylum tricornutum CCAP 1055/1]EEC48013.1 predicted protein [Phaeodactylum tricornutum CCAP 1055/1]|eukprot:XP_002180605.1 predicted protein [Phaeodactylum tricornutum CCAP 1055/1]